MIEVRGIQVGSHITGIDAIYSPFPISGVVLLLGITYADPVGYAKIRVDSPALPPPEVWVNLRLFGLDATRV